MGRGRAKAKQTKVARQLKYNSGGTDLESLRRELIGEDTEDRTDEPTDEPTDEYDDLYARYADLAEDDEDEESRR
jgi:Protein of unknown function (DUF3073)